MSDYSEAEMECLDDPVATTRGLLACQRRLDQAHAALLVARDELARWGWGDFHYGSQPQEKSVTDALAVIDKALEGT